MTFHLSGLLLKWLKFANLQKTNKSDLN